MQIDTDVKVVTEKKINEAAECYSIEIKDDNQRVMQS